tara:strand:- start:51 stop:254 length:204 start_codon:yes stop_codon:yes gene_type:complete
MLKELNKEDLQVIFDVLNVYDPNDISHVYPKMGEQEFLDGVHTAWRKILFVLDETTESRLATIKAGE